eukprot:5017224-Pleurochrysis_carterae.AAC.3
MTARGLVSTRAHLSASCKAVCVISVTDAFVIDCIGSAITPSIAIQGRLAASAGHPCAARS